MLKVVIQNNSIIIKKAKKRYIKRNEIMNYRLYLTENCNLKCKYCYENNKTTNEIDFENIKYIIDYEIKQNGKTTI